MLSGMRDAECGLSDCPHKDALRSCGAYHSVAPSVVYTLACQRATYGRRTKALRFKLSVGVCLLSSAVLSSMDPPSALPPAAWAQARRRLFGPTRALLENGTMTFKAALAVVEIT